MYVDQIRADSTNITVPASHAYTQIMTHTVVVPSASSSSIASNRLFFDLASAAENDNGASPMDKRTVGTSGRISVYALAASAINLFIGYMGSVIFENNLFGSLFIVGIALLFIAIAFAEIERDRRKF